MDATPVAVFRGPGQGVQADDRARTELDEGQHQRPVIKLRGPRGERRGRCRQKAAFLTPLADAGISPPDMCIRLSAQGYFFRLVNEHDKRCKICIPVTVREVKSAVRTPPEILEAIYQIPRIIILLPSSSSSFVAPALLPSPTQSGSTPLYRRQSTPRSVARPTSAWPWARRPRSARSHQTRKASATPAGTRGSGELGASGGAKPGIQHKYTRERGGAIVSLPTTVLLNASVYVVYNIFDRVLCTIPIDRRGGWLVEPRDCCLFVVCSARVGCDALTPFCGFIGVFVPTGCSSFSVNGAEISQFPGVPSKGGGESGDFRTPHGSARPTLVVDVPTHGGCSPNLPSSLSGGCVLSSF